jgi:hypothetical protein
VVAMGVGAEPFDSDVPISCTYHRPHLKTTVYLPVVHGDIASPGKHAAASILRIEHCTAHVFGLPQRQQHPDSGCRLRKTEFHRPGGATQGSWQGSPTSCL